MPILSYKTNAVGLNNSFYTCFEILGCYHVMTCDSISAFNSIVAFAEQLVLCPVSNLMSF